MRRMRTRGVWRTMNIKSTLNQKVINQPVINASDVKNRKAVVVDVKEKKISRRSKKGFPWAWAAEMPITSQTEEEIKRQ